MNNLGERPPKHERRNKDTPNQRSSKAAHDAEQTKMSFQAVWPRHCTQLGSFSPIFYDGAIIPVSDKVI